MNSIIIAMLYIAISVHGPAYECSIVDKERAERGAHEGVKGNCSNNGDSIVCIFEEGRGVTCDGPEGTFSGYDLNELIFSACGCISESGDELKDQLREELKGR
jgi:hypothetical protein